MHKWFKCFLISQGSPAVTQDSTSVLWSDSKDQENHEDSASVSALFSTVHLHPSPSPFLPQFFFLPFFLSRFPPYWFSSSGHPTHPTTTTTTTAATTTFPLSVQPYLDSSICTQPRQWCTRALTVHRCVLVLTGPQFDVIRTCLLILHLLLLSLSLIPLNASWFMRP